MKIEIEIIAGEYTAVTLDSSVPEIGNRSLYRFDSGDIERDFKDACTKSLSLLREVTGLYLYLTSVGDDVKEYVEAHKEDLIWIEDPKLGSMIRHRESVDPGSGAVAFAPLQMNQGRRLPGV